MRHLRILAAGIIAAAVAGLTVTAPARAMLITVTDSNSDFTVTYDDQQVGLTLFGTPMLSNNTIFFLPNNFAATSANGQGIVFTNATVHMRIDVVTDGFSLDQFDLTERGDYLMSGANTSVSATGQMRVFDGALPGDEFTAMLETGPLTISDGLNHDWLGTAEIDASDGWNGAQQAFLTLQNNLFASTADPNTLAYIEKKFEGVEIQVSNIPVPAAIWLFAGSLLALGWRR